MTDRYPLFHRNPADNLFWTPFLADQQLDLLPDLVTDTGLRLVVAPRQCEIVGLLGTVALQASVPAKLPADRSRITANDLSNLRLNMACFLERVNLVSFLLGKLRVVHLCSS